MQNKVEYHIQSGSFFTFKVQPTKTVKIGDVVELSGDRTVQQAAASSKKVMGVVYSGTVGVDGVNVGYQGDRGDVATVIVNKPFVYLVADGAITAGDKLQAGANGAAKKQTATATYVQDEEKAVFGMAITGATAGNKFIAVLM